MGGEKPGPNLTDRGKQGVKRSLLTEGQGIPIGMVIAGANRHDMKLVRTTLQSIRVERPEPTTEHPQGLCLDKGYDYEKVRAILQVFGFTAHIRARGVEAQAIAREAGKTARRWAVERSHLWLNRFRRLLVQWDKKAENDLAFLHVACGLIACRAAGLFGYALTETRLPAAVQNAFRARLAADAQADEWLVAQDQQVYALVYKALTPAMPALIQREFRLIMLHSSAL